MSGRRKTYGITKQHAQALADVLAWLRGGGADPLTLGVVEDVASRVAEHAKDGAILRVRLKNQGNRRGGPPWSASELEWLHRLWRSGSSVESIAEEIGRTVWATYAAIQKQGLRATDERRRNRHVRYNGGNTPLSRARAVMQERRRREAEARRQSWGAA